MRRMSQAAASKGGNPIQEGRIAKSVRPLCVCLHDSSREILATTCDQLEFWVLQSFWPGMLAETGQDPPSRSAVEMVLRELHPHFRVGHPDSELLHDMMIDARCIEPLCEQLGVVARAALDWSRIFQIMARAPEDSTEAAEPSAPGSADTAEQCRGVRVSAALSARRHRFARCSRRASDATACNHRHLATRRANRNSNCWMVQWMECRAHAEALHSICDCRG
jgi:hypothetical protein